VIRWTTNRNLFDLMNIRTSSHPYFTPGRCFASTYLPVLFFQFFQIGCKRYKYSYAYPDKPAIPENHKPLGVTVTHKTINQWLFIPYVQAIPDSFGPTASTKWHLKYKTLDELHSQFNNVLHCHSSYFTTKTANLRTLSPKF